MSVTTVLGAGVDKGPPLVRPKQWDSEVDKTLQKWSQKVAELSNKHERAGYWYMWATRLLAMPSLMLSFVMIFICVEGSAEIRLVPATKQAVENKEWVTPLTVASFVVIASIQLVIFSLNPAGAGARHVEWADRYATIVTEIEELLHKPQNCRQKADFVVVKFMFRLHRLFTMGALNAVSYPDWWSSMPWSASSLEQRYSEDLAEVLKDVLGMVPQLNDQQEELVHLLTPVTRALLDAPVYPYGKDE